MMFSRVSGLAVIASIALSACTPLAPSTELEGASAEEIQELCNRRQLTPTEIAYLRARPDFAELLLLISDDCLAPGSIVEGEDDRGPDNPDPGPDPRPVPS
jgi:hypothetical protein